MAVSAKLVSPGPFWPVCVELWLELGLSYIYIQLLFHGIKKASVATALGFGFQLTNIGSCAFSLSANRSMWKELLL